MSCCGRPVALASLGSFEPGNLQRTVLSIPRWTWLQLIFKSIPQRIRKVLEFSLNVLRLILFGVAVLFSLVVALHLSVLFPHWQATFIFVVQVLGLSSFSRMAVLCQGPFYLPFCKPPCRQLAFLESSQVKALELALLLRPPREAFLTTSSRPWVAGQVKLIFCMCAHRWTPSSR